MRKLIFTALAVASLAILPTSAQAVPISGDLSLAGGVRVTATDINWLELGGAGGTNEFFVVPDSNADYFTPLLNLTFGDATDLNAIAQPAGPAGFPSLSFLTFDADAGLVFYVDNIALCSTACFIAGTPFNAFETVGPGGVITTTIQMSMGGTVQDTTGPNGTGEISRWTGTWSADFEGETIADLLLNFGPNGRQFIEAPYSGQLNVRIDAIPEPATLLTFGAGTALLAAHRRRRAKKNSQI